VSGSVLGRWVFFSLWTPPSKKKKNTCLYLIFNNKPFFLLPYACFWILFSMSPSTVHISFQQISFWFKLQVVLVNSPHMHWKRKWFVRQCDTFPLFSFLLTLGSDTRFYLSISSKLVDVRWILERAVSHVLPLTKGKTAIKCRKTFTTPISNYYCKTQLSHTKWPIKVATMSPTKTHQPAKPQQREPKPATRTSKQQNQTRTKNWHYG